MNNLTLAERKSLVTGDGNWHTMQIPGKVPSILMTDGPHGIRKQHGAMKVPSSLTVVPASTLTKPFLQKWILRCRTVSMYLITYIQYTMKLSVAQFSVISVCIVVCLIWNAINDPMMGIIIENSHLKLGKFKPFILAGSILNAIMIVLLFTVRPGGWLFVAFLGTGYLLWGMTYTMNDIAYRGMLPSLSRTPMPTGQLHLSLRFALSDFSCLRYLV